jgi:F420-0:gamma-glutamyl ligase-like protein
MADALVVKQEDDVKSGGGVLTVFVGQIMTVLVLLTVLATAGADKDSNSANK